MNHQDHVNLIQQGMIPSDGIWGDFGSGQGAFTLALADLLDQDGLIYSVDRDGGVLRRQAQQMQKRFPTTRVQYLPYDFTRPLDLPPLDGIVMANSLHFVADKHPVLARILTYLKPGGRLIVVEYNTDHSNRWVPYPMTFSTWQKLAQQAGFVSTDLLMTRPSSFLGEFFSAVSVAPDDSESSLNT